MLTSNESAKIVRDCIRSASGFSGPIQGENTLAEVGIVDDDMRDALNDEIVTNETIGVQSRNHELGPEDLTFSIETTVSELTVEVMTKAIPSSERFVSEVRTIGTRNEVFDTKEQKVTITTTTTTTTVIKNEPAAAAENDVTKPVEEKLKNRKSGETGKSKK